MHPTETRDPPRPLDLAGGAGDAIVVVEHLVACRDLAVYADQVVLGVVVGDVLAEKAAEGGGGFDFDVIGKAAVELRMGVATQTRLQNRT